MVDKNTVQQGKGLNTGHCGVYASCAQGQAAAAYKRFQELASPLTKRGNTKPTSNS